MSVVVISGHGNEINAQLWSAIAFHLDRISYITVPWVGGWVTGWAPLLSEVSHSGLVFQVIANLNSGTDQKLNKTLTPLAVDT